LLTGALASLVVVVTEGGKTLASRSPEVVGLVGAAVAPVLGFVRRERRAPEPFVPLCLFANPVVRVSDALNLLSGLLFYCRIFLLSVFLQEVAGVSPTVSGLLLIPFMTTTALATLLAGRRVETTGRYRAWPIAGGVFMTVGAVLLASLSGTIGTRLFGAVLAAGLPDHGATAASVASALPAVFLVAISFALASLVAARRLEEHPLREHARFAAESPRPAMVGSAAR